MKKLIICCDGTWNSEDDCSGSPDADAEESCKATNVWRISQLIAPTDADGNVQRVFYQPGVGTDPTRGWFNRTMSRLCGGAFGWGLDANIIEAYRWLIREYEPGDALWLFGFSRGAYTARSLGGLLRNCGLLRAVHEDQIDQAMRLYRSRGSDGRPDAPQARSFRLRYAHNPEPKVKFIGVWDTVGSLGLPSALGGVARLWNRRYQFHDCVLSSRIANACHALAIDERRKTFEPAMWEWDEQKQPNRSGVHQVWFAGVHSDAGGGYKDRGLSDVTLKWMISHASAPPLNLAFDEQAVSLIKGDPLAKLHDSRKMHHRIPTLTRPRGISGQYNQAMHESVQKRMDAGKLAYKPENLPKGLAVVGDAAQSGSAGDVQHDDPAGRPPVDPAAHR